MGLEVQGHVDYRVKNIFTLLRPLLRVPSSGINMKLSITVVTCAQLRNKYETEYYSCRECPAQE